MFQLPGTDRSIKKAYQQAMSGNVDEAVTLLRRAARSSDAKGDRAEAMGMILYQAGRWGEAADALQHAVQVQPRNLQRVFYFASATARANEWDQALAILDKAAKGSLADVAPLASKCLILLERPDIPGAVAAYQQAKERFDANPAQDSYSMGLLEQCAEALAALPNGAEGKQSS